MILQPINSLPIATSASSTDINVLVQSGIFKQVTLNVLAQGFPEASQISKGLMSASDKTNLNTALEQISNLVAPVSTPIASAGTIAIPPGRYVITLSGVTTITAVTGLVPRIRYVFNYPTGAGLTFLGEQLLAGDVVEIIDV